MAHFAARHVNAEAGCVNAARRQEQSETAQRRRAGRELEDGVVEPFEAEEKRAEKEAYDDEQGVEEYIKKEESRTEKDTEKWEARCERSFFYLV